MKLRPWARMPKSAGGRFKVAGAFAAATAVVAVILAPGSSQAAVPEPQPASRLDITSSPSRAADGTQTVSVGGYIVTNGRYETGIYRGSGIIKTVLQDVATSQQVGAAIYTPVIGDSIGGGNWRTSFLISQEMQGRKLVVRETAYPSTAAVGSFTNPTGIKDGATVIGRNDSPTNANKTVQVRAAQTSSTGTLPNPTGSPTVVTDGASGATVSTVATDLADGDRSVAQGGMIKDTVSYTGLKPGVTYVIHTRLFDQTAGKLVDWTRASLFMPQAPNGSLTVQIPVPANSEGHTFVVYQNIWKSSDVLVGKHNDRITVRPNAVPVVKEDNPNNAWQSVLVPGTPKATYDSCVISGYVWMDANKNGLMDADEQRVPGVDAAVFQLTANTNEYPGTAIPGATGVTDASGFYQITIPGEYCGRVYVDFNETQFPGGWQPFGFGDSDLKTDDLPNARTIPVDVPPGGSSTRNDAGLRTNDNSISGIGCGPLMEGYTVTLQRADNSTVATTTINNKGQWGFSNIPAGNYKVRFDKMHGFGQWAYTIQKGGSITWATLTATSAMVERNQWQSNAGTDVFTTNGNTPFTVNGICGSFESPIMLDLNGNGEIDTASAADQPAGAKFDLLNTGVPVNSGWAAEGDGFLVKPNANGKVKSAKNLFGGSLGEGFDKLAKMDKNDDGVIDGAELSPLKVWVDANGDHRAQKAEIQDLAAYDIASLDVAFENKPVVNNGNVVVEHGAATKADGSTVLLGDAYFEITGKLNAKNRAALAASSERTAKALEALPAKEAAAISRAFAKAGN